METRIQTGATAAALALAVAALSGGGIRLTMLIVSGLILAATFANKISILERLPGVGAPRISAKFERPHSPQSYKGEVFLHIGVDVSTRLEDGVIRFYVPEGMEFWNADERGLPSEKGRLMLPTREPITPGIELYQQWFDKVDFRRGPGLISFILIVEEPRTFNVRFEIDSEKFRSPFQLDYEVTYP